MKAAAAVLASATTATAPSQVKKTAVPQMPSDALETGHHGVEAACVVSGGLPGHVWLRGTLPDCGRLAMRVDP